MNPPVIINQAYPLYMSWLPQGSDRSEVVDAPTDLIVGWRYANPTTMIPLTTSGEVIGHGKPHMMIGISTTAEQARDALAQIL
jgi:hypothetical protein